MILSWLNRGNKMQILQFFSYKFAFIDLFAAVIAHNDIVTFFQDRSHEITVLQDDFGLESGVKSNSLTASPQNGSCDVLAFDILGDDVDIDDEPVELTIIGSFTVGTIVPNDDNTVSATFYLKRRRQKNRMECDPFDISKKGTVYCCLTLEGYESVSL